MWLATKYGFFSIVRAHAKGETGPSHTSKRPSPTHMMVRARNRDHLTNLRDAFPGVEFGEVLESAGTDYPYRFIILVEDMLILLFGIGAGVDYTNFKNEVHDALPRDAAYNDFLDGMWRAGLRLGERRVFWGD